MGLVSSSSLDWGKRNNGSNQGGRLMVYQNREEGKGGRSPAAVREGRETEAMMVAPWLAGS